ncbi:MAG TPA: protein kinase [Gemmatales bacterium]|nr:protein kinase [Gemmatales bacterium]HMP60351.1 protein kinase [Gemmatales bacterium]
MGVEDDVAKTPPHSQITPHAGDGSPREPGASPLPGYRLIEPLGRGGFGEVWKCEAPGGILKAIKFVRGSVHSAVGSQQAAQEFAALKKVMTIRHPFLLSMDRFEEVNDELLIVMELADETLIGRYEGYKQAGYAGIPRDELLSYVAEAAEALDIMNAQHNLLHLDIKPGNLFLVGGHVKVADFGLVGDLRAFEKATESGEPTTELPGITPLYCAPEVLKSQPSVYSDQYSLAIVYQELLTGVMPFTGKNPRSLAMQHLMAEPHLDSLPPKDLPIVAKALSKEPDKRYPSCSAFIQALLTGEVVPGAGKAGPISRAFIRLPGLDTKSEINLDEETSTDPKAVAVPRTASPRTQVIQPIGGSASGPRTERLPDTSGPGTLPNTPSSLIHGGGENILSGFDYLDLLGRSPLGEVWKVKSPDGNKLMAKIVSGFEGQDVKLEAHNIKVLTSIKHEGLVQSEVIYGGPGRLALLSELFDDNLWNRFQGYRGQRQQGIPRHELLGYLREAAETLDNLFETLDIHHLALNPRNLMLPADDALLIGDFGLVQLLWHKAGHDIGVLNPRYKAPEFDEKQYFRSSDVYALGQIYQEMLTGTHPFKKALLARPTMSTARNRLTPSRLVHPELDPLPGTEREIVACALQPDPARRFQTCLEFVEALEQVDLPPDDPRRTAASFSHVDVTNATWFDLPTGGPDESTQLAAYAITSLVDTIAATWPVEVSGDLHFFHRAGEVIVYKCGAMLQGTMANAKLEGFRQALGAQAVRSDDSFFVFKLFKPIGMWQKMRGQQPGLEISLLLTRPATKLALLTEVKVQIVPFGTDNDVEKIELLRGSGPKILEQLRIYLQASRERHAHERYDFPQPFQVAPVYPGNQIGQPLDVHGKDISKGGVAFYYGYELHTDKLIVYVPSVSGGAPTPVPAAILRKCQRSDGWWEFGAKFLLEIPAQTGTAGGY